MADPRFVPDNIELRLQHLQDASSTARLKEELKALRAKAVQAQVAAPAPSEPQTLFEMEPVEGTRSAPLPHLGYARVREDHPRSRSEPIAIPQPQQPLLSRSNGSEVAVKEKEAETLMDALAADFLVGSYNPKRYAATNNKRTPSKEEEDLIAQSLQNMRPYRGRAR